jgi:hypothetical protein
MAILTLYCTLLLLSPHSVQIWPKDKALVMPAGAGRNEPNSNPFCPPPVGRFKFSWYVCCFCSVYCWLCELWCPLYKRRMCTLPLF